LECDLKNEQQMLELEYEKTSLKEDLVGRDEKKVVNWGV
jgi:hypothetical protein